MKNKLSTILLASLIMLTACTAKPTDNAKNPNEGEKKEQVEVKDGVYIGETSGMQGPLSVEIEVKDKKIAKIDFKENHETPTVANVAIERIPQEIIDNQSLKIDTVSGATITSNAILRAVTDAAKKAGMDIDKLKATEIAKKDVKDETIDTDILVVGGGGAGFSAAITAAQADKNVTLIEKSSILGGDTLMAGDAINAVDTEAQKKMILTKSQKETLDSYLNSDENDENLKLDKFPEWKEVLAELKNDINAYYKENEGKEDGVDMPGFDSVALHMWQTYIGGVRELLDGSYVAPDVNLVRKLCSNTYKSMEWMKEVGLNPSFGENAESRGVPGLYTVLGAMWPRTHTFIQSKDRIDALNNYAEKKGVKVLTETKATELITNDDGEVVGAIAEKTDGSKITFNTKNGVILATGGFSANPKMVKEYDKYWGDDLTDHTLTTNLGTLNGDGITMAQAVGADTTGMEIAQLMPSSSPVKGTMTDGIWADAGAQIWIDKEGKRFVNEYAERDVLAKASLEQEDGIFYIIYAGRVNEDGEMLKGAKLSDELFGNSIENMVNTSNIWFGETLEELAEKTKNPAAGQTPAFSADQLRETIEKYNSFVKNQHDDDFGKSVVKGAIDLDYIDKTEGYGIAISPRKASLHHTMGGLKVDTDLHVLNKDGKIIKGLWAAGEVTGGIHGGNRLGGNAIADVFTFGRIAGENASKSK